MIKIISCICISIINSPISTSSFFEHCHNSFKLSSADFTQVNSVSTGDNFMKDYFYNLNTNMTNNSVGCCGYVSLEMLLSYIDVELNTNAVSDLLINSSSNTSLDLVKQNSPGAIPFPYLSNYDSYSHNDFYNTFIANSNYLFSNIVKSSYACGKYNEDNHGLELNDNVVHIILDRYLQDYTSLNYTISNLNTTNSSEASRISFILNEIDSNRPVIVGMYDSSANTNSGHMCIAYDYEVNNNGTTTIYYNCGWQNSSKTHAFVNSNYFISEVTSVNLISSHSHSGNYIINGQPYCPCKFHISHPSHTHDYSYRYTQYNSTFHRVYCMCGANNKQIHSFYIVNDRQICDFCGYVL